MEDKKNLKCNDAVNFRWSTKEINRVKKIAKKLKKPYQTFIKESLLKVMDEIENKGDKL